MLERERFEPGDEIRGRVRRPRPVWAVDLVRVEASPTATLEFTAASVAPLADGALRADGARGRAAERAGAALLARLARARADERVPAALRRAPHAGDRMPVLTEAERNALAMRFVCDYEARRFHVELTTAELRGGGAIAGRVHRDRELAAGPIIVRARCIEAWREAPPRVPLVPAKNSMRMPRWHDHTLWSQEIVAGRPLGRALGAVRVRAARRSAARRRGARDRVALRGRGPPPAAAAPRRARDRVPDRLPRDAPRARPAGAAAARVSGRVHPEGGGRLRARRTRLRARARDVPRRRGEPRSSPRPRRARADAARARRRHRQAHARADGQRRARDRARAGGRDARRCWRRPRRRPSRSRASPRPSRCRTRASMP